MTRFSRAVSMQSLPDNNTILRFEHFPSVDDHHCYIGCGSRLSPGHTERDKIMSYLTLYRVSHLVWDLGWVDFDFGCSTIWTTLTGQTGFWMKRLDNMVEHTNQSQLNPGLRADGATCTAYLKYTCVKWVLIRAATTHEEGHLLAWFSHAHNATKSLIPTRAANCQERSRYAKILSDIWRTNNQQSNFNISRSRASDKMPVLAQRAGGKHAGGEGLAAVAGLPRQVRWIWLRIWFLTWFWIWLRIYTILNLILNSDQMRKSTDFCTMSGRSREVCGQQLAMSDEALCQVDSRSVSASGFYDIDGKHAGPWSTW